jgi:predicted transcriptional regulator
MEKKIVEVTVRMSDTLKCDLQDIAMHNDRKLSDVIRIALELYLYGTKHRADEQCMHAKVCKAMHHNQQQQP